MKEEDMGRVVVMLLGIVDYQKGQIDVLRGIKAQKTTNDDYIRGYHYEYTLGEKSSGLDEEF